MRRTRSTASPSRSARPCGTIVARRTGSANCCGDPAVDVVGKARLLTLNQVKDELPVALRPGQARVYDPDELPSPGERSGDDLANDPPLHGSVSHDTPRPLAATGLELRLDEDERLPARCGEPQDRRQRELDADERNVAGDDL